MKVDTGQFSAITAETVILREHAQRAAPGRHRRPPRPRSWRRPWLPNDGMWWGGYAMAMREVIEQANAAHERTGSVAAVLSDVLGLAEGIIRLQDCDSVPAAWLDGGDGGRR